MAGRLLAWLVVAVMLNAVIPQDLLHLFSGHHDHSGCNNAYAILSEEHQHCPSLLLQLQVQQHVDVLSAIPPQWTAQQLDFSVDFFAPLSDRITPSSRGPPAGMYT
ncbi:MAG: hypothetical protein RMK52_06895 [Chitinophagales bacterium]|nr:hypothetical protein [Chitinophagales bacterium]MDW8393956.1 hypothetical protein [Chitinophagales bacterium]